MSFDGRTCPQLPVGPQLADLLPQAILRVINCLVHAFLTVFMPCAQFGCFWTTGQVCTATSRLIVHESIAPHFYELLKERAESIPIGDPLSEDSRLGPVVNASQYAKVMQYIEARSAQALAQRHVM